MNLLAQETSPYLLQHKDNPVHWRGWSQTALDEAARTNRPILLSIGYAACHWCHVMAHESFEHDDTAAVMNELFINIKVDREERPDIDAIYQSALAALGQPGGWPLTMFLTPQGEPFWGGTYFPREAAYGRPGFVDLLGEVSKLFHTDPQRIEQNRASLAGVLDNLSRTDRSGTLSIQLIDRAIESLSRDMDPEHGGLKGAPKFPQTSALELLWRAHLRSGSPVYYDHVVTSLVHMCQGGIYDHLGGGFARYCVDERWLAPHFEKMLYDNALLVDLMVLVLPSVKDPGISALFTARIEETLNWCLDEMICDGGGFASSLDADSQGEEGTFYLWTSEDIKDILGEDADFFSSIYDITATGNFEGKSILNRLNSLELRSEADEDRLANARQKLLARRAQRIRPGWDDKALADWNGLMISAFASAAGHFDNPDWAQAAQTAFEFVSTVLTAPEDRLYHAFRAGMARHDGMLEDYTNMARAALSLHTLTGEDKYIEHARRWVVVLESHFHDAELGGYFQNADDTTALITRTRTCLDNATPAGNSTMVTVLTRLFHLTGEQAYQTRATEIIQAFSGDMERNFFPLTGLMIGYELAQYPLQIVIIGDRENEATKQHVSALTRLSLPNLILSIGPAGTALAAHHPAADKHQLDGEVTTYVCHGPVCSAPITDPLELYEFIVARGRPD